MTLEERVEDSFEQYRTKDIDYVVSPYSEDNGTKKLMFNNEYDAEEEYFRFYKQGFLAGVEKVKADCDFVLEGKNVEIAELEQKLEQTEKDLADYQFNYPKIKELEQQIEQMQDAKCTSCTELGGMQLKINRLEKENAELKKKCYKKAVKAYCKLEQENAELKADNDARKFAMAMSEKVEEQLREQIKQIERVSDYNADQLTQAKDIIQQFLIQNPISDWLVEKADKFIKEIEKVSDFNADQLAQAKEIILKLYNAGRDVLMCGYTEETQKRLSDKINAKEIEQFFKE